METRYRFSLAHEVGHLLLHADLYRGARLTLFEGWLAFHEGLDPILRDSMEWQARSLAGRILVPGPPLLQRAQQLLDCAKKRLPKAVTSEALFGAISIPLAEIFNVHEEVVRIRLSADRLGRLLRP
jgi:Zn-dependent peptidase ImmA (M78 family)